MDFEPIRSNTPFRLIFGRLIADLERILKA
jgi:hypothetical protein